MRPDLLTTGTIDRNRQCTVQHKMIRGRITSLLLLNSATWHYHDIVTIKLRSSAGMLTVVDRVPALVLADRCDLMKGRPTIGTPAYAGDAPGGIANGRFDGPSGINYTNAGQVFNVDAFELPLGHITLNGDEELEIVVETCPQYTVVGGNTPVAAGTKQGLVQIVAVSDRMRTDYILTYEIVSSLEETHNQVREIMLVGKKHVSLLRDSSFAGQVAGKDIRVKLKADGEDSETPIEVLSALTAINGDLTTAPNSLIRLFRDMESIPATCYVKVSGSDKDEVELLIIRETQVPHMVAASVVAAVTVEQQRVEKLEINEPEKAAALIQMGKIASSADLQKAKENLVPAVAAPVK